MRLATVAQAVEGVESVWRPLLTYPEESLAVRRDHPKYLNLILAVTFLYQLQRPVHDDPELGEYIETTLDDASPLRTNWRAPVVRPQPR